MAKKYNMDRIKLLEAAEPELMELFLLLQRLKHKLDAGVMEKLERSVPFADILFDRWERAAKLGFGEGTSVYDSSHIFGDVKVGKNTWIGPFTILDGTGGLSIGNNCSISASVQIYTHDSVAWAVSGGKDKYEYAATSIGNNCYIAPGCVIAMGVHIGDGSIVGANSFVNQSFPAGSKIGGTPARLL